MDDDRIEVVGQPTYTITTPASSEVSNIRQEPQIASTITPRDTLYTFAADGDEREKEFADLDLRNRLPKFEEYWRLAIVPATNRPTSISIREEVDDDVLLFCQFNYSILVYLLRAQRVRADGSRDGKFRDFFSYLQQSKEQLELFCLVRELVMNAPSPPFKNWEEILSNTSQLKNPTQRGELLEACEFSTAPEWQDFKSKANVGIIERMRNALCHGPEISTYVIDDSQLTPRLGKHGELLWKFVPDVEDRRAMKGYFQSEEETMRKVIEEYADCLNAFYKLLVEKDKANISRSEVLEKYGRS